MLAVSIKIFYGDSETIVKENSSMLQDTPLSLRLGFPDVVFPGDVRNELYIKLWSGDFSASQSSGTRRNVAAFGEGLDVPADDVRLYLALRECAHQRLFAHVPWLAPRLDGAIDAYARGIRMDPERMNEAMQGIDPSALGDPERLRELMGSDLFALAESEEQQAALRRLETLLALIEGWVDDVVTEACAATLPSAERLGEAMRRRRAAGGPAERTFASLVGLEMRPRALREAAALWREVREQRGIEGRDGLWAHPDLLPAADDLADPSAFLATDALGGYDADDARDGLDDDNT